MLCYVMVTAWNKKRAIKENATKGRIPSKQFQLMCKLSYKDF